MAFQLLNSSGILISSSCSMHLALDQLQDVIRRASLKEQRAFSITGYGFQAADHPVHPSIPETLYLKTIFGLAM